MPLLILPVGNQVQGGVLDQFLQENRSASNVVIRGQGAGLTFCEIPIYLDGLRPTIEGLTIDQTVSDECLRLDNPNEFVLRDIWVNGHPNQTCYTIAITDAGVMDDLVMWPKRGEEEKAARACNADMYSCYAHAHREDVNGWRIVSELTGDESERGFITNLRWFGGHTVVGGQGFSFEGTTAGKLWNFNLYGHYADLRDTLHMFIGDMVYGVNMFGEYMESMPYDSGMPKGDENQVTGREWEFRYFGRPGIEQKSDGYKTGDDWG